MVLAQKITKLQKELKERQEVLSNPTKGICLPSGLISEYNTKYDELKKLYDEYHKIKMPYTIREFEVINPIKIKISEAIKQFAKEKGYEKIIDLSKLPTGFFSFIHIDENIVDITVEFIKYYNSLPAKQQ